VLDAFMRDSVRQIEVVGWPDDHSRIGQKISSMKAAQRRLGTDYVIVSRRGKILVSKDPIEVEPKQAEEIEQAE